MQVGMIKICPTCTLSQCARLSVLIFRKILRDNPKVLVSFVRSGLEKVDVQFIEEMIHYDHEGNGSTPMVYADILHVHSWLALFLLSYTFLGKER